MCGIAGFTGEPDSRLLNSMCASIVHRGPDDQGCYHDERVSIGMRRLAIVDIESGQQPIANEDETVWAVFNGEIYNFEDLRRGLVERGHKLRTHHSDTETIVHLYEEHGPEWVEHVWGMFGLAVWDKRRGRLCLYRDRLGKKPLYWARSGRDIVFGSEIKSLLLHPGVSREPDPTALFQYFGLKNTSAPRTAYRDIRQLEPGQMLVWQDGEIEIKRWWRADFSPLETVTEEEAAAEIRRLFEDAVRLRMKCDAPFGAYLSGGVDSSAVATLMSRFHDRPVKTFCLGYEDEAAGQFKGKANDILFARQMSERIDSDHHEFIINYDLFAEKLPEVLAAFDEPFSGSISTYFLSILIKEHVKVAVSGDGADELFASYLPHRMAFPMQRLLAMGAWRDWGDLSPDERQALAPFDNPDGYAFLSSRANPDEAVWRDALSVFPLTEREKLLSPDFLDQIPEAERKDPYAELAAAHTASDALNRTLETDQAEILPNQVLPFVDRLSMAHSVEVRCPFLDHRLVEYVNRLPGRFKISRGDGGSPTNKAILKRAVADLLPPELVNRPKEGFVPPIYSWMHGGLKPFMLECLADLPASIFNRDYLDRLTRAFDQGDESLNARVWNLVCFSVWLRHA
ncbi:asparagine synthase (glutamine-hydrolyzing) [Desulfohalovibrio reitneri]|uniref:asparagine synthase (glutamine-hydrolyzing) n=1 Tax=Desulfohalovibrio reitneri TaxID=1307759 RepID=UPI000690A30E|nr:asparagine synthase (glutamine-hydrolyzing) [Desulfohalovibrio reitneri]